MATGEFVVDLGQTVVINVNVKFSIAGGAVPSGGLRRGSVSTSMSPHPDGYDEEKKKRYLHF